MGIEPIVKLRQRIESLQDISRSESKTVHKRLLSRKERCESACASIAVGSQWEPMPDPWGTPTRLTLSTHLIFRRVRWYSSIDSGVE
jgi:TnpA family transposase